METILGWLIDLNGRNIRVGEANVEMEVEVKVGG
jgi:hypothetical protein